MKKLFLLLAISSIDFLTQLNKFKVQHIRQLKKEKTVWKCVKGVITLKLNTKNTIMGFSSAKWRKWQW